MMMEQRDSRVFSAHVLNDEYRGANIGRQLSDQVAERLQPSC